MTQRLSAAGSRIALYLDELARWGGRVNLVGSTDHDALQRHVRDSLAAAPDLPRGASVVDLGTGAGFPGIPLLLARPDLRLTLVDSRERRIHFLRHVARTLDLDCVIQRVRIESLPGERFGFALLRAVAPLREALRLAVPWAREDGEIWVWTRERGLEEIPGYRGEIGLGEGGSILRARAAEVSRETPA